MATRGGGSVVNVSSTSSRMSMSPYAVSKLTVKGLTLAFAQQLATANIRVNTVEPGLMDTESALKDLPPDIVQMRTDRQLIKRLGKVSDVVSATLYFCSDEASFVSGESLAVSGGWPLAL
jgi:NAD(P)-dependent dehydrogenase (short-subunit alcohol dehydrogenase family)